MTAGRVRPVFELAPADELELLLWMPPEVEDPASVWLAWHKRHIRCWDRIADEHPWLADTAMYMANGHVRCVNALLADPDSRRARHGYWDLGPKLTDSPKLT
jgi:hypothetical protein